MVIGLSERIPKRTERVITLVAVSFFLIVLTSIAPVFTGLVINDPASYETLFLNKTFSTSDSVILPFEEPLLFLKISGSVQGSGNVLVLLTNGSVNKTVYQFDSLKINQFTGLVIRRTKLIQPPKNILPPKDIISDSSQDNFSENKTFSSTNKTIDEKIFNASENNSINDSIHPNNSSLEDNLTSGLFNNTINRSTSSIDNISSIILENDSRQDPSLDRINDSKREKQLVSFLFEDKCQDSCYLDGIINASLLIITEGNISLHIDSIDYKLKYPVIQKTNISNINITQNETIFLNMDNYFEHSKSLFFDTPKIEGLEVMLINKNQLMIRGSKPGKYKIFVYATNGDDLLRSNNFNITIKPLHENIINKTDESLENVDERLKNLLLKKGSARIIISSDKGDLITTDKRSSNILSRVGVSSLSQVSENIIDKSDFSRLKKENKSVYLKVSNSSLPVKQLADDMASVEINYSSLDYLLRNGLVDPDNILVDESFSMLMDDVIHITRTDLVHEGNNFGSGENICILDSGANLQFIPINDSQITAFNVLDSSENISDSIGHGTSITYAVSRMIPKANFVLIKVVGDDGKAYASDIIAGIDFCESHGADIISISLGAGKYSGYCDDDLVAKKINSLNDSLVFVASGNDAYDDAVTSPACARKSFAVGSSTKQDGLSSFTNYDDATLLVAPGEDVVTIDKDGNQILFSGTSIATPIAASIAILVKENQSFNSSFNDSQLRDLLVHTGKLVNNSKRYFSRIDALSAINQYVTNNLSSTNVSIVTGGEDSFSLQDWSVNYSNDFSSSLSGWSGETSYFSTSSGVLKESDWQDHKMYRGSSSDDVYQLKVKIQDTDDNNRVGVVFHASSTSNYYTCYLDTNWDNQFNLDHGSTNIVSTTHSMGANTWYYLKVEVNGSSKKCKAWAASSSEPSSWDISTTDSSATSGYWGVLGRDGVEWDDFEYLTWTAPPYDANVTADTFDGGTTDFTSLTGPNVSGLTLENSSNGKIVWNDEINVENMNYDEAVTIGDGFIYVDTSKLSSQHNSSANLTIYNVDEVYPVIFRDGSLCSSCEILSQTSSSISFNVTGFSNYSVEEGTNLSIWDSSDHGLVSIGSQFIFYANYSNITSRESINGSNDYCEFIENSSGSWSTAVNMSFNSSSKLYEINKSFSSDGTFTFNVSCFDDSGTYANLSSIDTFEVQPSTPVIRTVSVEPSRPLSNETLKGFCNATDVDSTNIDYYYTWFKNDVEFSSGSRLNVQSGILINLNNISSSDTSYGDEWKFSCKAGDGSTNSSWTNSSLTRIVSESPSVSLESPSNNSQLDYFLDYKEITFNCSATDDLNLHNISLYLGKDGSSITLNKTSLISGTSDSSVFKLNLTSGVYTWNCKVYDNDSSYSWAENNFTLNLSYLPTYLTVSDDTDDNTKYLKEYITFYANYSSSSGLITSSNSYCEFIENSSGSWSSATNMTKGTDYYYISKNFSNNGTFDFNISCFTDQNNRNLSKLSNFSVTYIEVPPPDGWQINYTDNFSSDTTSRYALDGSYDWIVDSGELRNNHYQIEVFYYNGSSYNGSMQFLTKLKGAYRAGIAYCYDDGDYYTFYVNTEDTRMQWNKYIGGTWYGVSPYGQYENLTPSGMSVTSGAYYWLRIMQNSSGMYVKIWDDGDSEPSDWKLSSTETCSGNTYAGFFGKGNSPYAYFDEFEILTPYTPSTQSSSSSECTSDSDCSSGFDCIDNYCFENPGQFIVKNNSGNKVMIVDGTGRMALTGSISQSCSDSFGSSNNLFIINGSSGIAAWLNGSSGDLCLKGSLFENQNSFSTGNSDWLIKNRTGSYVMMINGSSGNLYLRKTLLEGLNLG